MYLFFKYIILMSTTNTHKYCMSMFTYTNMEFHTNACAHMLYYIIHAGCWIHTRHVPYALPLRGAHTVSTLAHMRTHMVMRSHTRPLHTRNRSTHTQTQTVCMYVTHATYLEETWFSAHCRQQPSGFSPSLTVCQTDLFSSCWLALSERPA